MRWILVCVLLALTCSGCGLGRTKKSLTPPEIQRAPVVQVKRERVPTGCPVPEPPLPAPPSAENCADAMVEDTGAQTGPWAQLMRHYTALRDCVVRYDEKAKQ